MELNIDYFYQLKQDLNEFNVKYSEVDIAKSLRNAKNYMENHPTDEHDEGMEALKWSFLRYFVKHYKKTPIEDEEVADKLSQLNAELRAVDFPDMDLFKEIYSSIPKKLRTKNQMTGAQMVFYHDYRAKLAMLQTA